MHPYKPKRFEDKPPLTEPIIVNCAFITGCAVEAEDYTVRIVAWERTMGG
jgi:hypothetical protein